MSYEYRGLAGLLNFDHVRGVDHNTGEFDWYSIEVVSAKGNRYEFSMTEEAYQQWQTFDSVTRESVNSALFDLTEFKFKKKVKVVGF